jgi:phosphoribosyl 1,2-cyclic phosphodiesterase
MKVKFYGTRGSIPVSHRDFLEFGGNTTCLKITRDNGRIAIIDAGTGIRELGKDLLAEDFYQDQLFIGFTHFHWDHIQGFPFFASAYNAKMVINLLAMGKGRNINYLEGKCVRNTFLSRWKA